MGSKQTKVHNTFLGLKRPYDPTDLYTSMCKLMGLKEEAIERGLGKLFREGKLKSSIAPPKRKKPSRVSREDREDVFR